MQVINTNVLSLTSQRALSNTNMGLQTALERLSTGLRINSAKDDAAGLGISERMGGQIRGMNQAIRNANDGISLAQTAEGALGQVSENLQRIRELSVQSANATNSASDRAAIQSEVDQLTAEITRVAEQTNFNNLKLLDGSFSSQTFQVGANNGETINVASIADVRSSQLGRHSLTLDGTITGNAVVGAVNGITAQTSGAPLVLTTDGVNTSESITYLANSGADAIADAINAGAASIGVTATASNSGVLDAVSLAGDITFNLTGGDGSAAIAATVTDVNDLTDVLNNINAATSSTGVSAAFTTTGSKASLTLSNSDGSNIIVGSYTNDGVVGNTETIEFGGVSMTDASGLSTTQTGIVELVSNKGAIQTNGNASAEVFASAGQNNSTFASIAGLDVTTASGATAALNTLDSALDSVNAARGDLGAIQNRFESTVASLQITAENLTASRSRIQDADFAAETAALTRSQILQQAGVAMLAQANQAPQTILSLLR